MSRNIKPFFILTDLIIIITAFFSSFIIINEITILFNTNFWLTSFIILSSYYLFSSLFRLNKKIWQYASVGELKIILKTLIFSIALTGILQFVIFSHIQYRLLFVTWLLQVILIGGSRFSWRVLKDKIGKYNPNKTRTLIVGAGSAGAMVARQLLYSQSCQLRPIVFVDDDPRKQQYDIYGLPVVGKVNEIPVLVKKFNIENIIIAIPSLKRQQLNSIYETCLKAKVKTKILPMLEDLVTGKVSVSQFREVSVEDLLGREQVKLDNKSIQSSITNKVVLVTGAGGSIGSELCRQISDYMPAKLILLGHGENSIYNIEMELKELYKGRFAIETEIADIQDQKKILSVVGYYKPDVIYHAAAHKHVPLMERNPEEAFKNNTIGTMNVAKASDFHSVNTFVLISSDKAVNPTSVMGATKRLAEMVVQDMNKSSETNFAVVRFGNVLGSSGSVIPLFKKQIEKGGPITITHPEMVRYFMTIPEASRLVIQAGCLARGGETFVLDMGEPVKIVDLAKNMIKLSGNSFEDIPLLFTGIRPGEKLYEELLNEEEIDDKQVFPKIYLGKSSTIYINEINDLILSYPLFDKEALRKRLLELSKGTNEIPEKQILSKDVPVEA
ncbi:polysaccharide biosynthesis protein [Salipaludibacillus daqingensis]|uniref:polysaccharide biosynthesis protein n=1 Tax=Salipaludibacillus daqingensis TaxID=3041001 RepID=UPI002474975B|nr:nucleoside-diphosphate sugar epimerase/dehydratase [Salipaludibacillus daqingensis]